MFLSCSPCPSPPCLRPPQPPRRQAAGATGRGSSGPQRRGPFLPFSPPFTSADPASVVSLEFPVLSRDSVPLYQGGTSSASRSLEKRVCSRLLPRSRLWLVPTLRSLSSGRGRVLCRPQNRFPLCRDSDAGSLS